jgi:hypothetical protein
MFDWFETDLDRHWVISFPFVGITHIIAPIWLSHMLKFVQNSRGSILLGGMQPPDFCAKLRFHVLGKINYFKEEKQCPRKY